MKSILFILSHAPHGTSLAREGLDAILAASAITETISVLFVGDGVWQLKKGQQPQAIGQRHIEPTYAMLDLYDVNECYVQAEALKARGMSCHQRHLSVRELSREQIRELIHAHDYVLRF